MEMKRGYCFKHGRTYTIYFKGVKCPECHKEDFLAKEKIFEIGNLPGLSEEYWNKAPDVPREKVRLETSDLSSEPCGYCGDANDPEVMCTKCWNEMHQKEKDEQFAQFIHEISTTVTNGLKIPSELLNLQAWELVDFPHFRAVRHRKGDWTHIFLKPTGQEINLEALGKKIILHSNGIEWIND